MADAMPPVTMEHLRAAFELMAWKGWTLEAALRDPIRSRVLRACAAHLRTQEYQRTHRRTVVPVRRYDPRSGCWCTQRVAGRFDDNQPILT